MKVVILAGGFGTRLSEYTERIPKPMVSIGGKPILFHIMRHYAHYGHKDFYIALGYKAEIIKEYFLKLDSLNPNFTLNPSNDLVKTRNIKGLDWNVTLVDTGVNSMTGGRLKRIEKLIGDNPFMLTYGDGLSNIDVNSLIDFHRNNAKMVTVTAVHPVARFGELEIDGVKVKSFQEKPQVTQGWINGGFFVCEPEFLNTIKDDSTILEREPLENIAKKGQLVAFKHEGFWQCMDTKRDKDLLEELWRLKPPWRI